MVLFFMIRRRGGSSPVRETHHGFGPKNSLVETKLFKDQFKVE